MIPAPRSLLRVGEHGHDRARHQPERHQGKWCGASCRQGRGLHTRVTTCPEQREQADDASTQQRPWIEVGIAGASPQVQTRRRQAVTACEGERAQLLAGPNHFATASDRQQRLVGGAQATVVDYEDAATCHLAGEADPTCSHREDGLAH